MAVPTTPDQQNQGVLSVDQAPASAYAPAPSSTATATSDEINNAPLTTMAKSLTKDLSGTYANVNGTIYNKTTGAAFSNPADFYKEAGVSSFNGLSFDTNYKPPAPGVLTPNTGGVNAALNSGQNAAFDSVNGNPINDQSDISSAKATAQDLIDKSTSDINVLQGNIQGATTGENDLRTQTKNYYDTLGISQLQDQVSSAQKAVSEIQSKRLDNKFALEDQYKGGGTEGFVNTADERQQRVMSLQELAATTQLQVAQQRLSSQIDVFKVFTSQADEQQKNTISTLSTQLSLDKTNLQAGVQLLNQARLEAHGDEQAAKQLVTTIATQVPGLFQALTPEDQQNLSQGKITPTILAEIGKQTTISQQKAAVAQQNANTNLSRAFGQAYGLSQYGGPQDGTKTIQNIQGQERIDISQQRLQLARDNAIGGGTIDAQATAQDLANSATSLSSIPPQLQGYFEQKRDALGNTYVVPKVAKGQQKAFAATWQNYWKENTSPTYSPNVQAASGDAFNPQIVAKNITDGLAAGKGYTEIRAQAQSNGVPLTVFTNALKTVYRSQGELKPGTK